MTIEVEQLTINDVLAHELTQVDGPIRLLELFGGIGACTQAFRRIGVPFEVVDYVEIDKYAVKSYNAINHTDYEPQDITEWDKNIEVDFIMHGSPCQDFSVAGLGRGADEGSGTRSSLMYETLRIVDKLRPKYVLWENVKNVVSKKHKHNFDAYLERMELMGYQNHWQILNTKNYGVPQNRERLFVLSILGGGEYVFPKPVPLRICLKDVLEDEVDEKYYLKSDKARDLIDRLVEGGKIDVDEARESDIMRGGVDLCSRQAKLKDNADCIKARYDAGVCNFKDDNTGVMECEKK